MKLKTATLAAGIGTSIHFALMVFNTVSSHHIPYRYLVSSAILYIPLIIFFFVLYRNQK